MRLWHYKLIPYLPKTQLIAQWRELNSIYVKQDNHILINYIYNYDKVCLYAYSLYIVQEMRNRGYKIIKWDNYNLYFQDIKGQVTDLTNQCFIEHDTDYLEICYFNLKEKYTRGQKDFTIDVWNKLDDYYKNQK